MEIELAVAGALDAGVLTADLVAPGQSVSTQAATDAVLGHITQHCQVPELRD